MKKISAGVSAPPNYSCNTNECVDGMCEDDFCGCAADPFDYLDGVPMYHCVSILA
jgi:hypothetical protein